MKLFTFFGLALIAQTATAHYIFDTLIAGKTTSTKAVRKPAENGPINDINSPNMRCNVNTSPASETVSVPAGTKVGFRISNQRIYHLGPAAMYLGKAPGLAAEWDGSGKSWFKIAEWGAKFEPQFSFESLDKNEFTVSIPPQVPSGEYLLRIEQIGLHQPGFPEFYIACAQIKITGGGTGNPSMVSIPGYISKEKDPGLTVDIFYPKPTTYTVPGPLPFLGFNDKGYDGYFPPSPYSHVPASVSTTSSYSTSSYHSSHSPITTSSTTVSNCTPIATPTSTSTSIATIISTSASTASSPRASSCTCTCYFGEL